MRKSLTFTRALSVGVKFHPLLPGGLSALSIDQGAANFFPLEPKQLPNQNRSGEAGARSGHNASTTRSELISSTAKA